MVLLRNGLKRHAVERIGRHHWHVDPSRGGWKEIVKFIQQPLDQSLNIFNNIHMRSIPPRKNEASQPAYLIRGARQLAALKAAARQELMDVLSSIGTVSIAELAIALGKPADGLYYHIRILQEAGLVQEEGVREVVGRNERLYRAVSSELRLAYKTGQNGNAQAVVPIVDSMLRLTSRDFKAAFSDAETVVEGPRRELWGARTTGWLTEQQVEELNRHIMSMVQMTTTSPPQNGDERLYALTVVLAPLHR